MRLRGARGSALRVVGRFPPGGRNINAVQPPCPQGLNIERPSGFLVIGECGLYMGLPVNCRRYRSL